MFGGDLESVGALAFAKCVWLWNADLSGRRVKSIEAEAFRLCSRLRNMTSAETLAEIGASAFEESGLTELDVPERSSQKYRGASAGTA
jgi:hypothetical protein